MFGRQVRDDPKQRGRLRELIREENRTARLRVRCEHDRSVVAVVHGDCIVLVQPAAMDMDLATLVTAAGVIVDE